MIRRKYPPIFAHFHDSPIDPIHAALIWIGVMVVLLGLLGLPS